MHQPKWASLSILNTRLIFVQYAEQQRVCRITTSHIEPQKPARSALQALLFKKLRSRNDFSDISLMIKRGYAVPLSPRDFDALNR